jgi:hypothetical protein
MSFDLSRGHFDRNESPSPLLMLITPGWDLGCHLPAVSSSIGHTPLSVSNLLSKARTLKLGLRS